VGAFNSWSKRSVKKRWFWRLADCCIQRGYR